MIRSLQKKNKFPGVDIDKVHKRKKPKRKKQKSVAKLRKLAWDAFSLYRRLDAADHRDICTCYTCGAQQHWKESQLGHAIPGRHNAVLLNEEVTRIQCVRCNIFLKGNYVIFTTKLIKENGMEWWEDQLQKSKQILKLDRAHFLERIEWYTMRTNVMDKSQKWNKTEEAA